MAQDPFKYFRPEARELVDQFAQGVLDLEKGAGHAGAVQRLLRLAHTLKGAARVVKQSDIAERAHAIEDTLAPYRESTQQPERAQIDAILEHLDAISSRIVTLAPAAETAPAPVGRPAPEEGPRTVRTELAETDAVIEGVAETHALVNGLRSAVRGVEEARHLADRVLAGLAPVAQPERSRRLGDSPNLRLTMADELRRKFSSVERNLGSIIDRMDRELHQLRESAERLRLGSAESMFTTLERSARDTARALSKQVAFEARGGDIRLDSHVLEAIQAALIQIIRNALAHGIETPEERRNAGKPEVGHVSVSVFRRGRRIVFECRDDGRGVDLDAVRKAAQQRGLIGAGQELGADDVVRTLLRGGISTSKTVTNMAGRGVGLDVVRESVERLGGEVTFRTAPGAGTTFELVIPSSLASMDALIVDTGAASGMTAIPLDAVRSTMRVTPADLAASSTSTTICYEQQAIAFISLSAALGGTRSMAARSWSVVVVAGAGGLAAIGVDRLVGTARIVLRALPPEMTSSPIATGASLDADGNPRLVLDPEGLVAAAQRGGSADLDAAGPTRQVLVVDDSLTTRMLEQSILEAAGYDVEVAQSGEEAVERLRHKRYGLILVDVEMPGMDGFTFVRTIRADPATREIPAIMVTSLAGAEDRQRGRDAGAQGYIVKSEFDQAELLNLIRPLIG